MTALRLSTSHCLGSGFCRGFRRILLGYMLRFVVSATSAPILDIVVNRLQTGSTPANGRTCFLRPASFFHRLAWAHSISSVAVASIGLPSAISLLRVSNLPVVPDPAVIRAKMPSSIRRFQRLKSVLCGPWAGGALAHVSLAMDEDDPTQDMPVIGAPLACGLRKEGLELLHLCTSHPESARHVHCSVFKQWSAPIDGN